MNIDVNNSEDKLLDNIQEIVLKNESINSNNDIKKEYDEQSIDDMIFRASTGESEVYYELANALKDKKRYTEAIKWLRKAANNDVKALFDLAEMYDYGLGVEQDYEKALELYLDCADRGDNRAKYSVAETYYLLDREDLYWKYLEESIEENNPDAMYELAKEIKQKNPKCKDRNDRVLLLIKSYELGNIDAGYELAEAYANGYDVAKNEEIARKIIESLSKIKKKHSIIIEVYDAIGDKDNALKVSYEQQEEYPDFGYVNMNLALRLLDSGANYEEAEKYFEKAYYCYIELEKDNLNGTDIYNLGRLFENGWGTNKNIERAKIAYEEAAKMGNKEAEDALLGLTDEYKALSKAFETKLSDSIVGSITLYGIEQKLDHDDEVYMFVKGAVKNIADAMVFTYNNAYDESIKSAEDYLEYIPEMLDEIVEVQTKTAVKWFEVNVGEQLDYDYFYETYIQPQYGVEWMSPYLSFVEKIIKASTSDAKYQAFVEAIDINPQVFVASDGTLSGNISAVSKSIGTQFAMEAGFGVAKGFAGFLGGVIAEVKVSAAFNNPSTKKAYEDKIRDFGDYLTIAFVEELKKIDVISKYFEPSEMSGNFFEKAREEEDATKQIRYILLSIAENPTNPDIYKYALENFGDVNGELTAIGSKYGVDVDAMKQDMVELFFKEHDPNDGSPKEDERDLLKQLLYITGYGDEPLKRYDAIVKKNEDELSHISEENEFRKNQYLRITVSIWEKKLNLEPKSYLLLNDAEKEYVDIIWATDSCCSLEPYNFNWTEQKRFYEKKGAAIESKIGELKYFKKLVYRKNDKALVELAEEGYPFAYLACAQLYINNKEYVKALSMYDRGAAYNFMQSTFTSNGEAVLKIAEEYKDNRNVSEWLKNNKIRIETNRVFEEQKSYSSIRRKLDNINTIEDVEKAIDVAMKCLGEGQLGYRDIADDLEALYNKRTLLCDNSQSDLVTVKTLEYENLLFELCQRPHCRNGEDYIGVVNLFDEQFAFIYNAVLVKTYDMNGDEPIKAKKIFEIPLEETVFVIFSDTKLEYEHQRAKTILITDKALYYYNYKGQQRISFEGLSLVKTGFLYNIGFVINGVLNKFDDFKDVPVKTIAELINTIIKYYSKGNNNYNTHPYLESLTINELNRVRESLLKQEHQENTDYYIAIIDGLVSAKTNG